MKEIGMAATLKQIAEIAGVSVATVSRALNDDHRISEPTRKRIKSVASDMDYNPNLFARGLTKRKSQTVALLTNALRYPFQAEFSEMLEQHLSEHGYYLTVCSIASDAERIGGYAEFLYGSALAGAFFLYIPFGGINAHLAEFDRRDVPVTLVNCGVTLPHFSTVEPDREEQAFMAVDHLLRAKRSNVALLYTKSHARIPLGYRRACQRHEITPDEKMLFVVPEPSYEAGYKMGKVMTEMSDRPTGLFTSDSTLAIGAMRAFREAGLRVPEDIGVVAAQDTEVNAYLATPLTVVTEPIAETARAAADLMLSKLEGDGSKFERRVAIRPKLIVRASCGKNLGESNVE
jgi:LacI family transcriptional regulator